MMPGDIRQLSLVFDPTVVVPTPLWTPDEIYDRLSAENVLQFTEDRRVERKRAQVQPKQLAEYVSMWANTQPHGGLILVGVGDDGSIDGFDGISTNHKNQIENLSHLCPDARWVSKEVPVKNSKGHSDVILAFRVSYRPDKLVETSSGDAYVREGSSKIRISEPLKPEMRIAKGEIHYELKPTVLSFPHDFDGDEINKFCKAFFENRRFTSSKTPVEMLELAKLGKRSTNGGFTPNLACALLFAKDPRDVIPGARIRVIRYEGLHEEFGEQLNSVYSTFIDGNVPQLLADAKKVISSQMRTFQRYEKSGRLEQRSEYPEEAWFEAVVNAVAHRSYNLKTQNIFVKLFDDKFVVESPGGFVPPTTHETVYDAHNPRNPFLERFPV